MQTGWTACTGVPNAARVGIKVDVSASPQTTLTPGVSYVVKTGSGEVFIVAESTVGTDRGGSARAYAYPVPAGPAQSRIVSEVTGQDLKQAEPVPDQWITLFPSGGALALRTFELDTRDLASRWPLRGQIPGGGKARVGDLLTVNGADYLMTPNGTRKLDPFSEKVYRSLQLPQSRTAKTFKAAQLPSGINIPTAESLPGANWPTEVPAPAAPRDSSAPSSTPREVSRASSWPRPTSTPRPRPPASASTTSTGPSTPAAVRSCSRAPGPPQAPPARCSSTPGATPTPSAPGRRPTSSATAGSTRSSYPRTGSTSSSPACPSRSTPPAVRRRPRPTAAARES